MDFQSLFASVRFLTQNQGDGLHQVHHRLLVPHLTGVLRHLLALAPHIDKNPCVDSQHDEKGRQVEKGPEHQVSAAVHGCHGGAVSQVAQAVPAHGGDQTHDNGHQPDEHYDDKRSPGGHVTVELHVEDRLVALHGHSQEVGDRSCEARVEQCLSHKPLVLRQLDGPRTSMKHQVEVGDTWRKKNNTSNL